MSKRKSKTDGWSAGGYIAKRKEEFAKAWLKFEGRPGFYARELAEVLGVPTQTVKKYSGPGIIVKVGYDSPSDKRMLWKFTPRVGDWLKANGAI